MPRGITVTDGRVGREEARGAEQPTVHNGGESARRRRRRREEEGGGGAAQGGGRMNPVDGGGEAGPDGLATAGSGKAECVRAVDVLTVLREKVAFVSGGRDKRGGPILTFPARTNHDRIKQEDLSRLVTYLLTIP
ncbi:kalirin-like protein, partial [Lates japonicus]